MSETFYKVLTHDLRPPVQGGEPVFDGKLPFESPMVAVDPGPKDCSEGWNFCDDLAAALKIAGLWPNGRPSRVFVVSAASQVYRRGDKCRAAKIVFERELSEDEICAGVEKLSLGFTEQQQFMVAEQMAWRAALSRPRRDASVVERGLRTALDARGLSSSWTLRFFVSSSAAWDARAACAARDAWAARDARDAWAAWAACAALSFAFSARKNWIDAPANKLTVGLRDAFAGGLALAVPVSARELGWAMV